MLHTDLRKLLDLAIEGGEITEKHREILHKKAINLGQDLDELEMVIESEIQKIKNSNNKVSQKHDCPNCGSSILNSSIKCGFCGYEISKSKITGEDSIINLRNALLKLDEEWAKEKHSVDGWGRQVGDFYGVRLAQRKASLISTFSMPNDKENLLEFFLFCDNNADSFGNSVNSHVDILSPVNKILKPAWEGKARLGYNKLKRFENDDIEIKEILNTYKNKYYQDPLKFKAVSINTNQGKGGAVLMGLNQQGVITFFVLLVLCFPLCWIPFVIPAMKA